MTTHVMARFHCATEVIEAVDYHEHDSNGGFHYGVRIHGGRHSGLVIRCSTEQSAIRLFNEAKTTRTQHLPLWWLNAA